MLTTDCTVHQINLHDKLRTWWQLLQVCDAVLAQAAHMVLALALLTANDGAIPKGIPCQEVLLQAQDAALLLRFLLLPAGQVQVLSSMRGDQYAHLPL